MIILSIIIIIGVLIVYLISGLSLYAIIGGIIGLFLGSSLGVAGGGTAVNGIAIFGGIGFIIGGLISVRKRDRPKVDNISPVVDSWEKEHKLIYRINDGSSPKVVGF